MKRLNKYLYITKTSFQNSISYVADFFVRALFYIFLIFIFLMLWKVIYSNGSKISGYTVTQIIWYVIIAELVLNSKSNILDDLNNDIRDGSIAYLINKPYNYVLYQFANGIGQIGFKVVINILIAVVMGLTFVGPLLHFSIYNVIFGGISLLVAIILNFFILVSIGLVSFWVEENGPFYWIYSKALLILGTLTPIEFFPDWLQGIIYYLPTTYITYAPAKLMVDFSFDKFLTIFPMQLIYLIVFMMLAFYIFGRGVRNLNVNGG